MCSHTVCCVLCEHPKRAQYTDEGALHPDWMMAAGGIPPLIALLAGGLAGNAGVIIEVCWAVTIETTNDANKVSFAAAGGIPPLVSLLGGGLAGNAGVMKRVCWAVYRATANPDNKAAFVAAGGVPLLQAAAALSNFEHSPELTARFT